MLYSSFIPPPNLCRTIRIPCTVALLFVLCAVFSSRRRPKCSSVKVRSELAAIKSPVSLRYPDQGNYVMYDDFETYVNPVGSCQRRISQWKPSHSHRPDAVQTSTPLGTHYYGRGVQANVLPTESIISAGRACSACPRSADPRSRLWSCCCTGIGEQDLRSVTQSTCTRSRPSIGVQRLAVRLQD